MSFKVECNVFGEAADSWASNALRFASQAEAEAYGADLFSRWMGLKSYRVSICRDDVNYRWDADANRAVSLAVK